MTLMAQHCPKTWLFGFGIIAVLAVVLIGVPSHGQTGKALTKEDIAQLQAKYEADLTAAKKAGLDKQFSTDFFAKADEYAAKGSAALKAVGDQPPESVEADASKRLWSRLAPPHPIDDLGRVTGDLGHRPLKVL